MVRSPTTLFSLSSTGISFTFFAIILFRTTSTFSSFQANMGFFCMMSFAVSVVIMLIINRG